MQSEFCVQDGDLHFQKQQSPKSQGKYSNHFRFHSILYIADGPGF